MWTVSAKYRRVRAEYRSSSRFCRGGTTLPTPPAISRAERLARSVRALLLRVDARALAGLVSCLGVLGWMLPWQGVPPLLIPAGLIAFAASALLRDGRSALAAYGLFVLFWTLSQGALALFERPGDAAGAVFSAVLLGARLCILLGFALALPLAVTPLTLGRVLAWYLAWPARFEAFIRRTAGLSPRPVTAEIAWRASLALALMMAFVPRALRVMRALRASLALRAPELGFFQRMLHLGFSLLRTISVQTWDMALALAARDLFRPEPWRWQARETAPGED
jgi:hypothetical protein